MREIIELHINSACCADQYTRAGGYKEEIATFLVYSQSFCWERDTQAHCWRRCGSWFNREVFQDQGLLRANQRREAYLRVQGGQHAGSVSSKKRMIGNKLGELIPVKDGCFLGHWVLGVSMRGAETTRGVWVNLGSHLDCNWTIL